MSTKAILRNSALAATLIAGFTITAVANGNGSRYGNVYDYESGHNCGSSACVAPAPVASRYGGGYVTPAPVQSLPVSPGVVYVDCAAMGTCAPAPSYQAPVQTYQAPVQTYQAPVQSYSQSYSAQAVDCPAGTSLQSDGTCLQSSHSPSTAFSVTLPGTHAPSVAFSAPAAMESVACPAGTTSQADGTCMQSSGSSYSSSSNYSSGNTYQSSSSMESVACPAGTSKQSDGTCMQGGGTSYAGSTATIYSGDAGSTSSSSYGGYTSSGSYTANDYRPIRK